MARKARQRISYVLPLANSVGGHRLGVNGLAFDTGRSILYSGGRDGVICAWDLNVDLKHGTKPFNHSPALPQDKGRNTTSSNAATTFRNQVQAHTHWVNDILLAQSNSALVSASSDITVKLWRLHAEDDQLAQTIGLHNDYVKCLASPGEHCDWVASGGLDHKIRIWDLSGAGEKLQIDVKEDESSAKGSVYALSVRGSIMASGGPENIVRVWDPKSGKRITKLVGHTDNVRDVLINQDGDTIMTASSDRTIKVWSMAAGRCMHTLTMHNDSVWSLYSDHPQLSVFYSSDRSGLVAKTDVRNAVDMDGGLSVAIAQEHGGVNKIAVGGQYLWTATSSSSINRWRDVNTEADIQVPDSPRQYRGLSQTTRSKITSSVQPSEETIFDKDHVYVIPYTSLLRISNAAPLLTAVGKDTESTTVSSGASIRKPTEALLETDSPATIACYSLPEESIEGQNGLIKHVMLNDRRRVLTLDTAGDVTMWDLLNCVPIKSFGKRHLEDVIPEVNTVESVANWCGVDTRTGRLAVALEEKDCFDAETYADEIEIKEPIVLREDQRINLGKWVLRYLFANLIDEEIKRDEICRSNLVAGPRESSSIRRPNAPLSIQLPTSHLIDGGNQNNGDDSLITPRPSNGQSYPPVTSGLAIGVATPGAIPNTHAATTPANLAFTVGEGVKSEKRSSIVGGSRTSADYFSSNAPPPPQPPAVNGKLDDKTSDGATEATLQSPVEPEKDAKSGSLFGKKFRMNFPKKLGRSSVEVKPAVVDDLSEESDKWSEKEGKVVEDNFSGVLQKIRYEYDEQLHVHSSVPLASAISPSLPNETPVLNPPLFTSIIIQEDRPGSGGVVDLYRGTVSSVGQDATAIEKAAPMWLGELLLRNHTPEKETVKVSFVLQPWQDLLPSIASPDGNARLNANRMLRAKKILAYIAERIEPMPEQPDPRALKPEEFLDLYCNNQLVPHNMTLATLRAHVWKTGGDVLLYYKSNGARPDLDGLRRGSEAVVGAI